MEKWGLAVQDPPDVAAGEAATTEQMLRLAGVLHLTDDRRKRDLLFQAINKFLHQHGAQSETAERRQDLNPLDGPFSSNPVGLSDAESDRAFFLAVHDPQPDAPVEDRAPCPHHDLVGARRRAVS